jgi:hypothetical protein
MINEIDDRPVRIRVHPKLVEELEERRKALEEETGLKLDGGIPSVSYMVALELKRNRENKKKPMDTKNIKFTLQRIKGTRKNGIIDIEF